MTDLMNNPEDSRMSNSSCSISLIVMIFLLRIVDLVSRNKIILGGIMYLHYQIEGLEKAILIQSQIKILPIRYPHDRH